MSLRRRPLVDPFYAPREPELAALEARYVRWATRAGLSETLATHRRFAGRIGARDITFVTGLGGAAPLSPQIVVDVELLRERTILLKGFEELASDVERMLGELLPTFPRLRNVGLTPGYVRLTFEAGTEPEDFDAALDSLEEILRAAERDRTGEAAYRGRSR